MTKDELIIKYLLLWCDNEVGIWEDRERRLDSGHIVVSDTEQYREAIKEVTREIKRFQDAIKEIR